MAIALALTTGEFPHTLWKELVHAQGPNHVDVEFTRAPTRTKFAVKPQLNGTVHVEIEVLRLVGNLRVFADPTGVVLVLTGQDFDHRGFPRSVWTNDADHFCTVHGTFSCLEFEAAQLLLQVAPRHHGCTGLHLPVTVPKERDGFVSNSDVLLGQKAVEVGVDGGSRGTSGRENTEGTLRAVDDVHQVGEHVEDREVVLDDDDTTFSGQALDDANDAHALVDVEVGGRFVEEIHVRITQQRGAHGHTLQLTARQLPNFALEQVVDAQGCGEFLEQASLIHLSKQVTDLPFDALGKAVDVLWLHGDRNATFLDLDKEI